MIYRIGHRGAAGYEVENSRASILKSIELQVDYIEIDIQSSKEGELVVFHDLFLNRLTNGNGLVKDLTISEIQMFKLINGEKIMSFESLCEFCSEKKVKLLVELKNEDIAFKAFNIISKYYKDPDDYIFCSFFHDQLKQIKINIEINTCIIFEGLPIKMEDYVILSGAKYVSLGFGSVNKELISRIHSLGRKVFLWTIDDPWELEFAYQMNPDGIISNFPNRIKRN
jgi:glycerophosphoryl diester phosphodiesterase